MKLDEEHLIELMDKLEAVLREADPTANDAVISLLALAGKICSKSVGMSRYLDFLDLYVREVRANFEALDPEERKSLA